MKSGDLLWRVGHISAPLNLPPVHRFHWKNRFDDLIHDFRTLYLAESPITCLREVLADFKPSAAAICEFKRVIKTSGVRLAGEVTWEWLSDRVLVCGRLEVLSGRLIDLDDLSLRRELQIRHAPLLHSYGLQYLNISELTGPFREVTQAIARDLYDRGAAGLIYCSNIDALRCAALFEGRSCLEPAGEVLSLTKVPELRDVLEELGLVLTPSQF